MEATIQRKYALIRIAAGDYLLPDNDGERIWRIAQYEDGVSHGIESMDRDVTLWGVWCWADVVSSPRSADDPTDWGYWEMVEGWCETRREAIRRALSLRPERDRGNLERASDDFPP